MNEDLIRCIDCESCINGKCEFCNGAEIEDTNEEFVCIYFSQKNDKKYYLTEKTTNNENKEL